MAIFRTDVDDIAYNYLRGRVNGAINPHHSAWAPAWVEMSRVGNFAYDPAEGHPSWNLYGSINGAQFRDLMIRMGQYYGWIARGHYGLLTTVGFISVIQFEGWAYFVLNGNAPGAADHWNRVNNDLNTAGGLGGAVQYGQAVSFYDFAWNIINGRKDDMEADLVVCHSSCHLSCHGSRGRR